MAATVSLEMELPHQKVVSAPIKKRTQSALRGGRLLGNRFNITIENVVASADLQQSIDLESVARSFSSAKYNPNTFPGLIYRAKKPDVAILIFSSGKMIVAGAKSGGMAKRAVSKLLEEFKMAGIVILGEPDVTIRNMVATADLSRRIDLEQMATRLEGTIYDPEQFPGLIYRLKETRGTLLVFANGRVVCSGAHSVADVENAVNTLYETLEANGPLSHKEPRYMPEVTQQSRASQHTTLDTHHNMEQALRTDLQQHT